MNKNTLLLAAAGLVGFGLLSKKTPPGTPPTPTTYTITNLYGNIGFILPPGTITLNKGSNKTFTITSPLGYTLTDVLIDGASVGAVNTYTFTNVTANHTIDAVFTLAVRAAKIELIKYYNKNIPALGWYIFTDGQEIPFNIDFSFTAQFTNTGNQPLTVSIKGGIAKTIQSNSLLTYPNTTKWTFGLPYESISIPGHYQEVLKLVDSDGTVLDSITVSFVIPALPGTPPPTHNTVQPTSTYTIRPEAAEWNRKVDGINPAVVGGGLFEPHYGYAEFAPINLTGATNIQLHIHRYYNWVGFVKIAVDGVNKLSDYGNEENIAIGLTSFPELVSFTPNYFQNNWSAYYDNVYITYDLAV